MIDIPMTTRRCKKNLFILSLASLCNMTSYRTLEAMQSTLNRGVGASSLAVIYATCVISALVLSPLLLTRLKPKMCLALCPFGYAIYTAANFYPTLYTLLPGAVVLGVSTSVLWPASTVYITDLSKKYAKLQGANPNSVMGNFFGIFWCAGSVSMVLGMSLLALLLVILDESNTIVNNQNSENVTDVQNMSTTAAYREDTPTVALAVSSKSCGLYYEIESVDTEILISDLLLYCMYSVFLALNVCAALLCFFLDDIEEDLEICDSLRQTESVEMSSIKASEKDVTRTSFEEEAVCSQTKVRHNRRNHEENSNVLSNMKLVLRLLVKDKLALLVSLISVASGMMQAIARGVFPAAWTSCAYGLQFTVHIFICLGSVICLSSLCSGWILQRIQHIKLFAIGLLFTVAFSLPLLITKLSSNLAPVYFLLSCAIAVGIGIFYTQLPSAYNVIFPNNKNAAATVHVMLQTGGTAILYVVTVLTPPIASVVTVLASSVCGYTMFVVAYKVRDSKWKDWECSKNVSQVHDLT